MSDDQQKKADYLKTGKYRTPLVNSRLESAYQENLRKKMANKNGPIRMIENKLMPSGLHIYEFEQDGQEPAWDKVKEQFKDEFAQHFDTETKLNHWQWTPESETIGHLYMTGKEKTKEQPKEKKSLHEDPAEQWWMK
jgi:hypothetical protein